MSDVVIPAISGLLAMLGAFIGAALTRRTEFEKWLRQARTEAFATFLHELHDTRLYATESYYDLPGTENEKSIKVTEAFAQLNKHVAQARLFMSDAGREELSSQVNELWVHSTADGGPAKRVHQVEDHMQRIQAILEKELTYMPWEVRWPFK
ncbi:hypothetical protein [Rubrivivax sp. JA1026]|uniref:hypothetical protein n=1 Tax=Rubrivivax sp. JA1026 TaxID=2710888 RepID=UPI0013E9883B|nr:hypothetical protein [Rubrivivax sp. JA1026]